MLETRFYLDPFIEAGSDLLRYTWNLNMIINPALNKLRGWLKTGLVINPDTPADLLFPYLRRG